eukprot:6213108-Pleurochrysis_carterae.AAC.2
MRSNLSKNAQQTPTLSSPTVALHLHAQCLAVLARAAHSCACARGAHTYWACVCGSARRACAVRRGVRGAT